MSYPNPANEFVGAGCWAIFTQNLQDIRRQQQAAADLLTGKKVCPVANVLRLFRIVIGRHQLSKGKPPLTRDSLVEWPITD